jgi:hypothetical protein
MHLHDLRLAGRLEQMVALTASPSLVPIARIRSASLTLAISSGSDPTPRSPAKVASDPS